MHGPVHTKLPHRVPQKAGIILNLRMITVLSSKILLRGACRTEECSEIFESETVTRLRIMK